MTTAAVLSDTAAYRAVLGVAWVESAIGKLYTVRSRKLQQKGTFDD